jgi:hypothetical protein
VGGLTRSRFLLLAGGLLGALAGLPSAARAAPDRTRAALALAARNVGRRYAGDRTLFATVSPGIDGRDTAEIAFSLNRRATVRVDAVFGGRATTPQWTTTQLLPPGRHEVTWTPPPETPVGSYVMRLTIKPKAGGSVVLGATRPATIEQQRAAVVRVLGVEAAFLQRSYLPTEPMQLQVFVDAASFTLQFLRIGFEDPNLPSDRNDEMVGALKGDPVPIDWTGKRSAPVTITVQSGAWPSGLYAARLTTDDGRVGFAPFILRNPTPGALRQLVVLPTNTWQAYNMYDRDGDGWGDTWYAGGNPPVDLTRPYRDRGVPPRFKSYDRAFLRWLARTGRVPDMMAEDDLVSFPTGDDLHARYDLVVFSGHSEYQTSHTFDVIQRYRDLGGRLVFLSADNFYWRVRREGTTIRRVQPFRSIGRPEASVLGAQYRANDDGRRQAPYVVVAAEAAPWLFDKTGLVTGSTFGEPVGGYGIEIDMAGPDSPPGTVVLARVPDLFGPGLSGEMTYYETPSGARVFSAGTLDFGGSANIWPVNRMLENLWQHMLQDVPPPPAPPAAPAPEPPPAQ